MNRSFGRSGSVGRWICFAQVCGVLNLDAAEGYGVEEGVHFAFVLVCFWRNLGEDLGGYL